ncbi:MAG TPA: Fe2+-dependent dioxygenase [Rhizomicrobium sp.]|jgi:PKHD-type hydroxylase|nr:Fe2+-dependent dioxygenase [Rhizomicrobium sp.]
MFQELRGFLNPAEVARLTQLAAELPFVEGRLSNPNNVTKVNLQADRRDPRYAESAQIVLDAFQRSRPFRDFAFPKLIAPPLLSRYEPGMKYGAHADVAYMNIASGTTTYQLRADLSCTIFLNDPTSYQGGELLLHVGTLPVPIKGQPGEAFVYPSTLLHEVRPVTAGVRLVSITFIESLIPEERERNLLYEIQDVLSLEGLKMDWASRVRLEVVSHNLTRMWSQK